MSIKKKWDVFISHAYEDKNSIVRELANKLEKLGVKVWYDEYSLKLGDSLSKSIDEGLLYSNFGLIIISKNFLNKKWTDYEYRSLLSKEENGKKVLLPIWYNISHEEIKAFSLYLIDKFALDASSISIDKIVLKVVEVLRPDIYQSIKAYNLFKHQMKTAKMEVVEFDNLRPRTQPQSKLTNQQEVRVRNIYYGIGKILELSMEEHIFQYELDLQPEREIQTWEIMNLCFLEFLEKYKIEDAQIKINVLSLLIGFSLGQLWNVKLIKDEQKVELYNLWTEYFYEY